MRSSAVENSEDLQAQVTSLRQQLWTLLVLLVVVSGAFTIFLTAQVKFASNDLRDMQQIVDQGKSMDVFLQKLVEYSRTHPDFVPILTKYGITPTANSPAPVAAPKK